MDWGLGHATRDVPVIELLLEAGAEVVIGAANKPLQFLRNRFPQLAWVELEGYEPQYQKKGPLALKIAADLPKMMKVIKPVREKLERIIEDYDIDAVISDNRYELWSDRIPTVFMTHQLNIMAKGILSPARSVFRKVIFPYIEKFDEVWIPDVEGEPNLSGVLSHVKHFPEVPCYFTGPLSRFEFVKQTVSDNSDVDILCIMSGPEPQRSILEEKLVKNLKDLNYKTVMLSGNPGNFKQTQTGNIKIISHVSDVEMANLLKSAKLVISRSGYTTIMDLAVFGTKALFIPTPGQTEQEYLAEKFYKEEIFYYTKHPDSDLKQAIEKAMEYPGLQMNNDYRVLKERIGVLMERI